MDRLFVKSLIVLLAMTFMSQANAKRVLFASQFSLINVKDSHESFGVAEGRELNPDSIKVLVWNIKKGQERGLDIDLPRFGGDRDLMLIQEGYLSPALVDLFHSFHGMTWDMGVSFLYKKDKNTKTGVMVGSRVEPSSVKTNHTVDFEPFILTPKANIFAKYPVAGTDKELLVISVHGINFANHNAFVRHMNQAFHEIEKHDGPVIFAGDFNTRTAKRKKHLMQECVRRGFQSVDFIDGHLRNKPIVGMLDFTFVRGLKVKNPKVFSVKSSDHPPMHFEVALQ
jgi:endonuclease/exonuclease/phosphatase (EEP) superfamily protein YafD